MNREQIVLLAIATLILAATPIHAAAQNDSTALDNQTVLRMHKAGLSREVIIGAIRNAMEADFDLTPQALISLSKVNLPSEIISAMQQKESQTHKSETTITKSPNTQDLPSQIGVFLETADGLVSIERKNAKGKLNKTSLAKSGLGIWGKATGHNFVPGGTADSVSHAARPKLIFHLPTYDFGKIRMVKALKIKKDKRNFVNAKSGFAGKGMESNELAFTSTPAGAGYFIIYPNNDLESGEYALIDYGRNDEPATVWDFSVIRTEGPQSDGH